MSGISDLRDEVGSWVDPRVDYERMIHPIPQAEVKDRVKYILHRTRNKVVLDIGCTGRLSEAIRRNALEYHGVDKVDNPGIARYYRLDLDQVKTLPRIDRLQLVIASEVIEHLSNAGHFLDMVRKYNIPMVLTTPNGGSSILQHWLRKGIEQVAGDHVCWYSWHTLKTLVEKHGFEVKEWHWYKGKPMFAEGLIFELG